MKKRRALRTRALLRGTASRPRISVYKSNTHISIQCIDDDAQKTLAGGSTAAKDIRSMETKERLKKLIDRIIAALNEKNISLAVFDRGAYRFHGTVRAVADALRKHGIRI